VRVFVPKYSGFCPGVSRAERRLFERMEQLERPEGREGLESGPGGLSVLGPLIHNTRYVEYLSEHGIETAGRIEDIPGGKAAAIRTHGVPRQTEQALRRRGEVLDLTCYKVRQVQRLIGERAGRGFFVVITGKRSHPEVQGLVSYAGASGCEVVERAEDLNALAASLRGRKTAAKVLVVSQTTGRRELFEQTAAVLAGKLDGEVESVNTICDITSLREQAALELQKQVDVSFVVGDRMSSNAGRLYKTLLGGDGNTHFVQNVRELGDLGLPLASYTAAQVVSSSSTPEFVEQEIVRYLESV